jgi:purine nucleosidase
MRVIVDTDPALGNKMGEVDDGLALFFMLYHPEFYKIEGITTVFGNSRVTKGFRLIKTYLEFFNNQDIPHFMGSQSKDNLGVLNDASEFLISIVRENPREITLLTLGPLSNISTAILKYPEVLDDLNQIVFMGSTINPTNAFNDKFRFTYQNYFNSTEFNFFSDPNATKIFIETKTKTPRIGIGLDVSCKVVFKLSHLEMIKTYSTLKSQFLVKYLEPWLSIWKNNCSEGFYPFNTLVPIQLMKKEFFKYIDMRLEVDTEIVPGKLTIIDGDNGDNFPIRYAMDFVSENDKKEFMNLLIAGLH